MKRCCVFFPLISRRRKRSTVPFRSSSEFSSLPPRHKLTSSRIEQWNERYRSGEQVFDSPAPLVVEFAGGLAPGSALDLASGPGRNALYLARQGWRVPALDGSPAAIDILLARARQRRLIIDARVVDLDSGGSEVQS